jgi:hypothetical protein
MYRFTAGSWGFRSGSLNEMLTEEEKQTNSQD